MRADAAGGDRRAAARHRRPGDSHGAVDPATEVELGPADGMPERCALSLDNVRTVPKALVTEQITSLPPARMRAVCTALDRALGC